MTKVLITKISNEPQVQKLLRTFDANGDGYLEPKEVDADKNGEIDCNRITKK